MVETKVITMKIVKGGTFIEKDGNKTISGFVFDCEGGPVNISEMVRLAEEYAYDISGSPGKRKI